MAQVSRVIQADPQTLAGSLQSIAATEQIQIITKTKSAGKFIVVSDPAGILGQSVQVIVGDPQALADGITAILAGPATVIDVVSETFSAAYYIVVYR